ncbi:MAG: lipid-binding SYLF domain-containing protein [Candidatus Caldatribacteriota bacterium]
MKNWRIFFLWFILILILFSGNTAFTQELSQEEEKIIESIDVLHKIVAEEDQATVIGELLKNARGVAVFPKLTRIGLGIGVQFGKGLILRKDYQTKQWYGPSFIEIKTASVGPQIGIQDVSLLLIIMDDATLDGFKKADFDIGANISISPGPTAETIHKDAQLRDSIYTYSYREGLYAGFTLEGSVIQADNDANKNFYDTDIASEEILETIEPNNTSALKLIIEIEKISK